MWKRCHEEREYKLLSGNGQCGLGSLSAVCSLGMFTLSCTTDETDLDFKYLILTLLNSERVIIKPEICLHLPKTWVWQKFTGLQAVELMFPKSNFLSICSILPHLALDRSLFFSVGLCLSLAWWPIAAFTHWAPLINTCPISPSMAQG